MEHNLRLVSTVPRREQRASPRRSVRIPGQIVWKDGRGTARLTRIVTRDVSDYGLAVDTVEGSPIPLYRLVYVQLERATRESVDHLPLALQNAAVLSAVYRVGPSRQTTGKPESYALRLLVDPRAHQAAETGPAHGRIVRSA